MSEFRDSKANAEETDKIQIAISEQNKNRLPWAVGNTGTSRNGPSIRPTFSN